MGEASYDTPPGNYRTVDSKAYDTLMTRRRIQWVNSSVSDFNSSVAVELHLANWLDTNIFIETFMAQEGRIVAG